MLKKTLKHYLLQYSHYKLRFIFRVFAIILIVSINTVPTKFTAKLGAQCKVSKNINLCEIELTSQSTKVFKRGNKGVFYNMNMNHRLHTDPLLQFLPSAAVHAQRSGAHSLNLSLSNMTEVMACL